jgi:hypothetical protein
MALRLISPSDNPCRLNRSMHHPREPVDLTIRFNGPTPWGRTSFLPKHEACFFAFGVAAVLSLRNSWIRDFFLVLRRPVEPAPFHRSHQGNSH